MNKLLVIPSIDIKNSKTVRVVQGIPEMHTSSYGDDPIEMALIWRAENAKLIHVVDFDASQNKSNQNWELIEEMCDSVVIPIEYGGGINSFENAKAIFSLGVYRIIIGSLFFDNRAEFIKIIETYGPERVSAAIDIVDFEVVTHARQHKTGVLPQEHAKKLTEYGINRFIVTDILRNGMMGEPNIELSELIAIETGKKVTHSGGISSYKHLIELQNYADMGIDSAIVGRALYENKFSCQKIWRLAEADIFTK